MINYFLTSYLGLTPQCISCNAVWILLTNVSLITLNYNSIFFTCTFSLILIYVNMNWPVLNPNPF